MTSVSIPNHATNGNPVYGAIRAYNRMRRKHLGLLPLIPGTGKIVARGGKLVILLATVGGGSISFSATLSNEWRYRLYRSEAGKRLNGNGHDHANGDGHEAATAAGPRERVQDALSVILNTLGALERRANFILKSESSNIAAE